MIRTRSRAAVSVLAVLAAAVSALSIACASVTPPPQLSPIGKASFYSHKAAIMVDQLQTFAIDGERDGVISTDDARKIVDATKKAAQAGLDLQKALDAGSGQDAARDKAVAFIRSVLLDLPDHLSPNTAALVKPYITIVLTLLSFFA